MNVTRSRLLPCTLLLIILTFLVSTTTFAQFDDGEGTENDPWQVTTLEQLQSLADYPDGHLILAADIDASPTADWNDGLGFEPIGDLDSRFTGSLDGNGYTISDLTINRSDDNNAGLFGVIQNATLLNIQLISADISAKDYVGGLAGTMNGGIIEQSLVTGFINGEDNVGGLTGSLYQGTIRASYSESSINGINSIGGITGYMEIAEIIYSYSLSDVEGDSNVGGLSGTVHTITGYDSDNSNGMISGSFAAGSVSGQQQAGGLIGSVEWVVLTKSHKNQSDTRLLRITITDSTFLIPSYWDSIATGQSFAIGTDQLWEGFEVDTVGSNTVELQQQSTYEEWDFDEIWAISEEETYPYLQQLGLPVSNESESQQREVPRTVELHQNYPNPFNPVTVIGYQLPGKRNITLEVFDITGRRVAVLIDGEFRSSGTHRLTFQAGSISSGVYFYQLKAGDQTLTQKMTLIK